MVENRSDKMDEEERELKRLELERSHQCSIEIKRGAKNIMTWSSKQYYSPGMEKGIIETAKTLKKELDVLCEVKLDE